MRRCAALFVVGAAILAAACDRPPMSPTTSGAVTSFSDGRDPGGNPDFFFEPPMRPDPRLHPNFDEGRFNPFLSPMIRICALDPASGECAQFQPAGFPIEFTMLSPPPSRIRLVPEDEHYIANWNTRLFDLDPDVNYRVQVFSRRDLDGGQPPALLGFADVDVLDDGERIVDVDSDEFVPLRNRRTLPIKFRVELGVLCSELEGTMPGLNCDDATAVTLDNNGGDVVVPSQHGAGRFNENWIPQAALDAGITEVTVIIANVQTDPDAADNGVRCFPTAFMDEVPSCYLFTTDPELDEFGQNPAENLPGNQFIVFDRGDVISAMCLDPAILEEDYDEYQLFQYDPDKEPFVQNGILVVEPSDGADDLLDCSQFVALSDNPILRFAQKHLGPLWSRLDGVFGPGPLWARHGTSGQGALAGSFSPSQIGWARSVEQSIVSGDDQTAAANTQLSDPIVARIIEPHVAPGSEELPEPVANEPVTFTVTEGGVSPDGTTAPQPSISVSTDPNGEVAVFWTLGPTVGEQTMLVSSAAYNSPSTVSATSTLGILFGVNSADDGLSRIDPATGQVTFIGPLDPDPNVYVTPVAMAVRPSDGTIFVWNNSDFDPIEGVTIPTGVLLTVDPATGLATRVDATTPNQGTLSALAFAADGRLFGLDTDLFEIDPATGALTLIGSMGLRVGGADFDASGTLYGVELSLESERLVTIDVSTGMATEVGTLNPDIVVIGSIVFDATGTLIGSAGGSEESPEVPILFDIDLATAAVSNVRALSAGAPPQGMGFPPDF